MLQDSSYHSARVLKWSTIRVDSRTYSVPSRLIGVMVGVRLYPDHVEVYYKGHLVESGSGSCAGSSGCPPWRLRQSAASAMRDMLTPFRH